MFGGPGEDRTDDLPGKAGRGNMGEMFGGPGRDRTDDLFHAMEARSQLRHRPTLVESTTSILAHTYGIVKLRGAHSSIDRGTQRAARELRKLRKSVF
jgi:hypothetical protein